ncbi:Spy/CpxP family protein refolding chaperone [Crocosphaera sp.]|uniref:Spy/CpxP family protein refolding chaperone n=1 Tax=Crocosphaera sp. TaxID=2729996 RepID=UPI00262E4EAD|nr:Spy/CpxP family protein refolding chaperone [Crocosphaera sp.]MDJ0578669.1 Spy/CpxP family protein refolding chaperone [Crocosphaera sp.]
MISREFALIVTVLTLGIGGTIALASSSNEPYSSVLLSETKILAQDEETQSRRNRRRERTEQFQQALNLSDQQMQQLGEIRKKYRPQMQNLAQQMQAKSQELNRMMQGNASESDLRRKHQEIANLRQQMGKIRFESMLEMRTILNTEQRQRLAQFLQQRRQARGRNRPNLPNN